MNTKKKHVVDPQQFLVDYFSKYHEALLKLDVSSKLIELKEMMIECHAKGNKTIIVGNGGSAAIASHCSVDFNKAAGVRCMNFNESSLITCLANDYGYEAWVAKALEFHAKSGDLVILISSSGKSSNMICGADYALSHGMMVVTLTGFALNNPLKSRGHVNLWIDSSSYNFIECFHQLWLLAVCDLIAESRSMTSNPSSKKHTKIQTVSPSMPTAA
ncbi:MAG: phosphoheptose isomerase [Nitrospirales bacterium]|nr:MAG: phosphoheptose isomerase [Nitrospirales bacterium]